MPIPLDAPEVLDREFLEVRARLLQVAAVVGREADLDLLVRAADQDVDAVLDDLDPAIVHHLVAPAAAVTRRPRHRRRGCR